MFSLLAGWEADMWSPVINLFSFIPSYAWMLIVFTIVLKIVLSPLDFWQRKVSRDSMIKQAKLQPELEKLQKKYADNKTILNQKTMELYKREKYNVVGSCLSMVLNLVITLFIFITLFTGLMQISRQEIYDQYVDLNNTFYTQYNSDFVTQFNINTENMTQEEIDQAINAKLAELIDAQKTNAENALLEENKDNPEYTITQEEIDERAKTLAYQAEPLATIVSTAQDTVLNRYNEIKESWLWIENIWRPDTSVSGFPDYATFLNISNFRDQDFYKEVMNSTSITEDEKNAQSAIWQEEYELVTSKVYAQYSGWNGYFILVILAAVITYFSAAFSQKQSLKKDKTETVDDAQKKPQPMKFMKWILPIIVVIFTIGYSAAFALYIVVNSLMSFIFSIISLQIFSKMDEKKAQKEKLNKKVDYSR